MAMRLWRVAFVSEVFSYQPLQSYMLHFILIIAANRYGEMIPEVPDILKSRNEQAASDSASSLFK
jgi:hypothetical protein